MALSKGSSPGFYPVRDLRSSSQKWKLNLCALKGHLYPTSFLFYGSLTDTPIGQVGQFTVDNYVQAYSDPEVVLRSNVCVVDNFSRVRLRRRDPLRVVLPLMRPGIVAGWIFLATIFMREFGTSVFLYSPSAEPIGPLLFFLYQDGLYGVVGALGLLVCLVSITVVSIALRYAKIGMV